MIESVYWLHRESHTSRYFSLLKNFITTYGGKKLLDIGCAHGRETHEFYNLGFIAEGIDINADFIEQARLKYPNCRFKVGTIENLPYESNTFDVIFCTNTLFFTNTQKSIPELVRVLKPQGFGIMSYDIEIMDLEKNCIIHSTSLEHLKDILQQNRIVYNEYKERVDESPFKHRHRFYEIIVEKFE